MKQYIILILAIIMATLVVIGSMTASADTDEDGDDEHDHCMGEFWGDGWWGFWMIPMMFGFIIISFFVILLLRHNEGSRVSSSKNQSMSFIKERYARGEIERNEYLRIQEDLKR